MTYYTHVNRQVIDGNRKHGRDDPPVRFQKGKYGRAFYAHEVEIDGPVKVIYDGEALLPCGARLVIASETRPRKVR